MELLVVLLLAGPPELPPVGPKNMAPEEPAAVDPGLEEIREAKASQETAQEAVRDAEAAVLELDIFLDPLLLRLARVHLEAYRQDLKPEHLHAAEAALERIQNPGPEAQSLLVEVRSKTTPGLDPFRRLVRKFLLVPELDPFRRTCRSTS